MKKFSYILSAVLAFAMSVSCSETPVTDGTGNDDEEVWEGPYPKGVAVEAFKDDLGDGKFCCGYVATVDFSMNDALRFNVNRHNQKKPTRIYEEYAYMDKGKPYIVINGGYFSGSSSVGMAVSEGEVLDNGWLSMYWPGDVAADKRTVYPVRSALGQMEDGSFEIQWTYCVDQIFRVHYAFPSTMGNNEKTETFISEPPSADTPGAYEWKPVEAIGAGPRLVMDGQNVADQYYWEEIYDSGGTAGFSRQPRTAIGYTEDNVLIMIVCDGRGMNGSSGFTLSELADKFISLGASDAMNLDGGGSSAIVGYEGKVLNRPSDSGSGDSIVERSVTTTIVISEMQ